MERQPTGAERYLAGRLKDDEYRQAFELARERIAKIDEVIRALDARRCALSMTKAELARRAHLKPEAVRRLFSADRANPTLQTLVALADALDLELRPQPVAREHRSTPELSGASGTRRRSA
jgi:DNA-binding phage protein